jgi:hypothetical protein
LIIDCYYKRQRNGNSRHREEAAFRTKILTKGKWPILKCIALSTKIFFASLTFLQVLLLTIQLLKITKEGLQEAEGLEEEDERE